ncbi:3-deoxy-D-manno-octulosonic acid transferase [Maribacter sp. 2210JD10-5]|uniref:3-deoxy-D-manno-octulosonic acid transferase n=1 Tax=Maribacter sp. 2210JD10-5 TaxID=3386272 RepID=UPI0039BD8370
MYILYQLLISLVSLFLRLIALVNPKIKLFVTGRSNTFKTLEKNIAKTDKVIWIHAASLGEYEQGLPIMERLKTEYPSHKILLTFFSPSGFEIKKNTPAADVVTYLPMDSKNKVERFLTLAHPVLAIFIKYEIWPNYLKALGAKNIPTLLISSLFKRNQAYFKWYGSFMRKALRYFTHFYVQNENAKALLHSIGFDNVTIAGDTRLDRVFEILSRDNSIAFMDDFNKGKICFVAGSTWSEDEKLLVQYINNTENDLKYVIAPHNINEAHSKSLLKVLKKPTVLYSDLASQIIQDFDVLILDTIGLLTKVYSYADVAYVGGAFATGLHNTLEPAVFGIPVIIGPNYTGFMEAENLVKLGGVLSIDNQEGLDKTLDGLINHESRRETTGAINVNYITNNKGASVQIMDHIRRLL